MRPRTFAPWLVVAATTALAVRIAWVLTGNWEPGGLLLDAQFYNRTANLLAAGEGYLAPSASDPARLVPTADKPPLFPLLLAVPAALGVTGVEAHRLVGCGLGALGVAVLGLVGRRAAGERAGLVAAALAAVYPAFVRLDGSLLAEALYGPLVGLVLLLALRLHERPSTARSALLGSVVALASLVRPEGLLLLPLLAVPLALRGGGGRARRVGASLVCALVVLAPWTARNLAVFDEPVLLSTQRGVVVAGANCPATYAGPFLGFWLFDCLRPIPRTDDESVRVGELERRGLAHARDHLERLPVVLGVRVLRTWSLYRPRQQSEARDLLLFYGLALLAASGAVVLRHRRGQLAILLAPALLVTVVSLAAYGYTRYRYTADLALIVLAGAAVARFAGPLAARWKAS